MTSRPAHDLRSGVRCIAVGVAMMICVPSAGGAQSNEAPLRISPESAVSLALANNLNLESARRSPEIAEFNVQAAESVWTPTVVGDTGPGPRR